MRRDEIERFIEEELLDAVDEALVQFQQAAAADLEQELAEQRQAFIEAFGRDALDEHGKVAEPFRNTPGAAAKAIPGGSDLPRTRAASMR